MGQLAALLLYACIFVFPMLKGRLQSSCFQYVLSYLVVPGSIYPDEVRHFLSLRLFAWRFCSQKVSLGEAPQRITHHDTGRVFGIITTSYRVVQNRFVSHVAKVLKPNHNMVKTDVA